MNALDRIVNHPFWRTHGLLIARIFLGGMFLVSGLMKMQGGVLGTAGMIEMLGIPAPLLVAWLVIAIEIVAGAMVVVGYKTAYAALALIVFVLLATFFVHMDVEDPNFFKNLAIIGGFIYLMVHGNGGTWNLDRSYRPGGAI